MTPRILLFCNSSPAKRSLLPFKPSHFGIKNQSKTQSLFHTFFSFWFMQRWSIWGPPSKSSGRPSFQNRPLALTKCEKHISAPYCCGSWKWHFSWIDFDWLLDWFWSTSDRFGVELDGLLVNVLNFVIDLLMDLLLFWKPFLGTMALGSLVGVSPQWNPKF